MAKRLLRPRRGEVLELSGHDGLAALLRGNFIVCPTLCYRRHVLGPRRFNGGWRFLPDLDLYATLLLDGQTLVGIPTTAYAYRRHADSATARQTRTLRRFFEEIRFYDHMAEIAGTRGWDDVAEVAHKKRIVWLNLAYHALKDAMGLRLRDAAKKLTILARVP
jgi:hypothetical protein